MVVSHITISADVRVLHELQQYIKLYSMGVSRITLNLVQASRKELEQETAALKESLAQTKAALQDLHAKHDALQEKAHTVFINRARTLSAQIHVK